MYQLLGDELFKNLILEAETSPRKRSHYLLHASGDAPVQQICIGFCNGSYVRPHLHPGANLWEHLVVLRGTVLLLLFSDAGMVTDRLELTQGQGNNAITFPPNTWHTVLAVSQTAVLLETKEGPYQPRHHSEFATWAPAEGSTQVEDFMQWGLTAQRGDRYP